MIRSTVSTLAVVGLALAAYLLVSSARGAEAAPAERTALLPGTPIPDVLLLSLDGDTVHLDAVRGRRPTLLMVVDRQDCLGCGNYPLEMRVLDSALPHLRTALILVGPDTAYFARYARVNRIRVRTLLDPDRDVLRALELTATPALILADTAGRVLLTDHRDGPSASGFPISRLLPTLARTLTPSEK